jgi:hypothetical protein
MIEYGEYLDQFDKDKLILKQTDDDAESQSYA